MDVCLDPNLIENRPKADLVEDELLALVSRAVAGDRLAFSELITDQYDFIYRVALKWLGGQSDAEDVTQNVVMKLAKNIQQFDGRSKFSSWIYRITLNAVRDHQRQSSRHGQKVTALSFVSPSQAPSNQEDDTTLNEVWAAIRKLPDKQRDAVLMIYGEELSHADCAAIMGCKEKTVSWYVHEAKKTLKGLL